MSEERNHVQSPDHWRWTELGEVVERMANGTSADQNDKGNGLAVSRIQTISDGSIDFDKVKHVENPPEDLTNKYLLQKGDILLSHINTGLHLCKTGLYDHEKPLLHGMNLMLLRPRSSVVLPRFLDYLIDHYRRSGVFLSYAQHAVNQSSLNQDTLSSIEVPLPPLPEQRRIVAKIEELFSNLDAGMDDLQAADKQLERYRLSVLQAAVEGRLTADWRRTHDPEPADQLLERIEEERRRGWEKDYRMRRYDIKDKEPPSGWKDRYDPPETPDKTELGEIPDSWEWVVVDQLSPNIHYGYTESAQDEPVGPKFLRITDIQQDGQVNWKDAPYCEIGEQERKKYLLEPGDILFARTGGTVGKSCLIEDDVPEAVFASYLIRVITVDSIDERYVYLFFQTLDYWRQISEKKTGIGQPNVNATKLSKLKLPLPPLAEQKRIIDEVERLLSVADDAAATAEREHTRAERLRQSILKKAFSGQLVPHEEGASPPSMDGTASEEELDTGSSKDVDSDVEDLMGSADPSKQIEMDL